MAEVAQFTIVDPDKNGIRLASRIGAPGAQEGDVMTVGSDGYIATAPGGGGGIPEGWTQNPDESIDVTLADETAIPLAFRPADGATANATDQIEIHDDNGALVGAWDAAGSLFVKLATGGGGNVTFKTEGSDTALLVQGDGIQIAHSGKAGFFGASPIAQPEIPATPTAQDIADVLVALGLATQAA